VKEAGVAALKALGRLTVRLCDASAAAADGRAVISVVLPFLLSDGVTSPLKEAQAACLGYLTEIVSVAGPLLRPHIPEVAATALASMSNLVGGRSSVGCNGDLARGWTAPGQSEDRQLTARADGEQLLFAHRRMPSHRATTVFPVQPQCYPLTVPHTCSRVCAQERSELAHLQMHADAGTGHYGEGLSGERLEALRIAAAR
jgi:hypothetical protein